MVDLQGVHLAAPPPGADPSRTFQTPAPVKGPVKPPKPHLRKAPPNGISSNPDSVSWSQRKMRMDSALAWLKSEMELLRIHDKLLEAQFQQVQTMIDSIKKDREDVRRRTRSLSTDTDVDENEAHWEDWEIQEFEQQYEEEFGLSLDSRKNGASRELRKVHQKQKTKKNGFRMTMPLHETKISV